jgi:hypothetical protein
MSTKGDNEQMNDEWRLEVDFADEERALGVAALVEAGKLEHDLSVEFADRVILSQDGSRLFVYAGSRAQIDSAREALSSEANAHGWRFAVELRRWHPAAEEWRDPDEPLPATDEAARAERGALMERERQATIAHGYPEFEVRADLPSHHDAVELARKLTGEGLPAVHRWRYLLVGATDEDSAKELRERIESEAPPGSRVKVEGTWRAVLQEARNPFSVIE